MEFVLQRNNKVGILIPTYQPDESLTHLSFQIKKLFKNLNFSIIIVNDGSNYSNSLKILKILSKESFIYIINHDKNIGKGGAIKTGLNYLKKKKFGYVITADSDGQHLPSDIYKVYKTVINDSVFTIGQRSFNNDVPLRNKFGNLIIRYFFNFFYNSSLEDTQSGLRAFPKDYIDDFLKIKNNGYDYEFVMLILACKNKQVSKVNIETIYQKENYKSHFRPLLDSSLIYLVLLRYSIFVPLIALVDFFAFVGLSFYFSPNQSFIITRIMTFLLYFLVMKQIVFNSNKNAFIKLFLTFILFIFNLAVISNIFKLYKDTTTFYLIIIYIFCSILMFVINFFVQKNIVYRAEY